jgi:hypothetical protein
MHAVTTAFPALAGSTWGALFGSLNSGHLLGLFRHRDARMFAGYSVNAPGAKQRAVDAFDAFVGSAATDPQTRTLAAARLRAVLGGGS